MIFIPGQRWVSTTESELGLGIVIKAANRRVEINFPAAEQHRVYAMDNAPLSRVEYQPGEKISSEEGQSLTIQEVTEVEGHLVYLGEDESGNAIKLPEAGLNSFVQFSKPQDRMFAGQIDKNRAFELRCETIRHIRRLQQSNVRGLSGPRVQLLPHQLYIASETANRDAPRVLLADEVGLGKTIEAGLILHQQLITGRASRILIVVPDSLLHQWLVELLRRFNLMFTILDEQRCLDLEESGGNPFESTQWVLCTLSFLTENTERHSQALSADWDMLIVDEAHHLRWSEQQASAEYLCIESLARLARGLLLLTATPEQLGIASHFARLRLLDPDRYHDLQAFVEEEQKHQPLNQMVQQLMADDAVKQLTEQNELTDQLREYIGDTALTRLLNLSTDDKTKEFKQEIDLVVRGLLDRHGTGRVLFRNTRSSVSGFPQRELHLHPLPAPDLTALTSKATPGQLLTPELLLADNWISEDPRVQWLESFLEQNRGEKILLICAHADTAISLEEHLRLRSGVLSAAFHQGLTLLARDRAAAYFADDETGAQILVCSEIGSEGRNFQFSHHLVLFDLPLNPDLLEQRIGRLDRIGQRHTVQIHTPFYQGGAVEVLMRWYHEGINAFERTCPAGLTLFEFFEADLLNCVAAPDQQQAVDDLLSATQAKTEQVLLELQQGRDRLLELNSFNEQRAEEIVHDLVSEERRKELATYMEQVFDQYGVDQEHLSAHSLILKPGDHMLVDGFPALPEDGMTATFRREEALSREDMQFLNWEHPMVSGAMDLLIHGEFGNTALCTLKLPPIKAGSILLEAMFTLSCTAPAELQLGRYLPLTTIRLIVDHRDNDLSSILSHSLINKLSRKVPRAKARDIVRHTRPKITGMIKFAESLADTQKTPILESALSQMKSSQQAELDRLEALAEKNPNIRQEEIEMLQTRMGRLQTHLQEAQVRLDAIRVIVASE